MPRRLELQALHNTHREATRFCLMAASQGATDAQITHALRKGLPHFTDPGSLQDQSFGKQPQGIGIHAEQGKKDYEQKKRTRTTSQATQTQPLLLVADTFLAALEAVPAEDWCRTWAPGRTIMLRSTSKRFPTIAPCCSDAQKARSAGASQHTQGGNASLFEGGKSGGHRRADSTCSEARAPSFH